MRFAALTAGRAVLLAGPAVIAFFSGGYFPDARAWAGLVAWLLVAVAVVAAPTLLPRTRGTRLAVAGLALLAAWTLASVTWAPIAGTAYHAAQLAIAYVGVLLAAMLLLRGSGPRRVVEPALCAGAVIVVGYGLSERLVPGLLHFQRSLSAAGRLEQPLTYWNAMGELAALGFVLSVRLAGDVTRDRRVRAAAGACAPLLGLGLYLSFSRGALFACAAGLVALIVLAPQRPQLWTVLAALAGAALTAAVAAPLRGVTSLAGGASAREWQGLLTLVVTALAGAAIAAWQWRLGRAPRAAPLTLPRHARWIALALICGGFVLAVVVGAKERSRRPLSVGASRYETLQSNRYAYWTVALRAFGDEPVRGVGAGGWAVYWLRDRKITEFAQDAHSLPLQTMAELGLIGLALLAAFLAGLGISGRVAMRAAPAAAAGPLAGFITYIAHAPLDWDWQMPALTLIAMILGGALLAQAEDAQSCSAIRGASRLNSTTANTQIAA